MFSLFRSVTRKPFLNPARTIAFSSFSRTGATFLQDQNQLADILDDEANRHKPKPTPKSFSISRSVFSRQHTQWKPFKETTHIRPHHLTYKSRLKTRQPPRKRQTLGPGSQVARYNDVFHQLRLDPVEECQNPDLLAGFMSEMGKIDGREKTGLTTKNQRRLGKAIRRAKHMGIIPILSRPNTGGWRTRRSG